VKLELTSEERDELIGLVEEYFLETRIEIRHTQNRDFRNRLFHEESVLRATLEKLRNLKEDVEQALPTL
jgi:hypothetical protein